MNQVALASQNPVDGVGQIPTHLAHPQTVRYRRDPRYLRLPRREIEEEQHHKALQSTPRPCFYGKEVGGHDKFPMAR